MSMPRRCVQALADELEDQLCQAACPAGPQHGCVAGICCRPATYLTRPRAPEAVIVASCRAPHRPAPLQDLQLLGDHELAAELARYGGLPTEVLDRPEWLALLMPTVRDDLRIVQSFRPSDAAASAVPTAHLRRPATTRWRRRTRWPLGRRSSVQPQPVRLYPGGHFLFRSPDPGLVDRGRACRRRRGTAKEANCVERLHPRNVSPPRDSSPRHLTGGTPDDPVRLTWREVHEQAKRIGRRPGRKGYRPSRFRRRAGHRCRRRRAARAGGVAESAPR